MTVLKRMSTLKKVRTSQTSHLPSPKLIGDAALHFAEVVIKWFQSQLRQTLPLLTASVHRQSNSGFKESGERISIMAADISGIKYKTVPAFTVDDSQAVVLPNGELIAISKVRLSGADPSVYAMLAYDYGGLDEKIFASTRGDINFDYETSDSAYQITGDGIKTLGIVIVNDSGTESPVVGGSFEAFNFGVQS